MMLMLRLLDMILLLCRISKGSTQGRIRDEGRVDVDISDWCLAALPRMLLTTDGSKSAACLVACSSLQCIRWQ